MEDKNSIEFNQDPNYSKTQNSKFQFRYTRLVKIRWVLCFPIYLSDLCIAVSFLIWPVLPSTQPGINFWASYDYWTITFGVGFILIMLSLWKKRYIEKALFLSTAFYTGLFSQSIVGIFYGGSGVLSSYALTMIALTIVMGLVFLKGRD